MQVFQHGLLLKRLISFKSHYVALIITKCVTLGKLLTSVGVFPAYKNEVRWFLSPGNL